MKQKLNVQLSPLCLLDMHIDYMLTDKINYHYIVAGNT